MGSKCSKQTRNPGVEHPSQWDFSSSHWQEGSSLASNSWFSATLSPLSCKYWREYCGQLTHSKETEITQELDGKEWLFWGVVFFFWDSQMHIPVLFDSLTGDKCRGPGHGWGSHWISTWARHEQLAQHGNYIERLSTKTLPGTIWLWPAHAVRNRQQIPRQHKCQW